MDIITLAVGIAIGAAFSPFWMALWAKLKGWMATPPKQ